MRRFLHRARSWARSRSWVMPVLRWVATAPGTYLWLAALFATTVVLHHMSPEFEEEFLRRRSTNIHELSTNPVRVLVASAFWIDGDTTWPGGGWLGSWLPYAVLFTVFHAPAERRLGSGRWLAVVTFAHVGASLVSEGVLDWGIRHGHAPQSAVNTLDVGVSYALAGIIGVLAYRIPPLWHRPYTAAVLIFYGVPLIAGATFTEVGHFSAVLIGLACYPLTRARDSGRSSGRDGGRDRPPALDRGTSTGVRTPS
jgi:hypothetical protein